jgi:hypothetical protein
VPRQATQDVPAVPDWALAVGAWGDTFAGVGHAMKLGLHKILHYGLDPNVARFLRMQPWFTDVERIEPTSRYDYYEIVNASSHSAYGPWVARITDRPVRPVHVYDIRKRIDSDRWFGAALPEAEEAWADRLLSKLGVRDFYLVNPFSFQSTTQGDHWPWWYEVIAALKEDGSTYILVGQETVHVKPLRNVINLSGYTSSVLEVFALADRARGIITTCNGLSWWSIIQSIPAVVCCHRHHAESIYFWDWLRFYPNRIVQYDQGLDVFDTCLQSMKEESTYHGKTIKKTETGVRCAVSHVKEQVSAARG